MAALVFPFHDPNNIETKLLKEILPILKENFDGAFVSVTPKTVVSNPESVEFLKGENFFKIYLNQEGLTIGEHFMAGYRLAVENSEPSQVLQICTSDRLAFALLNGYREEFLADMRESAHEQSPTLFLRSKKAWTTHPQNYYAAEAMVSRAGEIMFGRFLDFTWCHLALSAGRLKELLPKLTAKDLVITSQLIFELKDVVNTKEVDWLSWEDPFVLGKDAAEFKTERENDPKETEKRLNYVMPEISYLFEEYRKRQ
jgi:hypothetical protein